ncbi:hypothetical protein PAECIP111892_01043 [Paenibacillus auburnensis]|uniref:Uncharacterized protein n=1 Tax=Paenibacillus auburnensis TaxID=2905649 RepID=A0ABN8G1H7_9BACL|nr:hypothetical protein PAECIP111892_01043 [Paenibacillus auburnensis]
MLLGFRYKRVVVMNFTIKNKCSYFIVLLIERKKLFRLEGETAFVRGRF